MSSGSAEFAIQAVAPCGSLFSQARAAVSVWLTRNPSSPIVVAHCTAACGSDDHDPVGKCAHRLVARGALPEMTEPVGRGRGIASRPTIDQVLKQLLARFPLGKRSRPRARRLRLGPGPLRHNRVDGIGLRLAGKLSRHRRRTSRIGLRDGRNDVGQNGRAGRGIGEILRPLQRRLGIVLRPLARNRVEQLALRVAAAVLQGEVRRGGGIALAPLRNDGIERVLSRRRLRVIFAPRRRPLADRNSPADRRSISPPPPGSVRREASRHNRRPRSGSLCAQLASTFCSARC